MKRLVIATIVASALVQAGAAYAGCWATVGLPPPPDGIAPGDTWTARMTVLQHGRTPLPDSKSARPTLTIRNADTGAKQTFVSRPTADPTVFQAKVVFPSAGSWRYEVFDDFTSWNGEPAPCAQTHTFAAIAVGGTAGAGGKPGAAKTAQPLPASSAAAPDEGFPLWPVVGGVLGALAALAAGGSLFRRRRGQSDPGVAVR